MTADPTAWLQRYSREYPDAWSGIEQLRAMRGRDLPNWPSWCYVPIAAGIAAVTRGAPINKLDPAQARDAAVVTALAAWRQTKGIYRFDADLEAALWDTPITGDLPTTLLQRLPEWCVYVPLNRQVRETQVHGAWAHLEYDVNDRSQELRLLINTGETLVPVPIRLGGSLKQGVESVAGSGLLRLGRMLAGRQVDEATRTMSELAAPIVSLLLYLCSEAPEIDGKGRPGNPQPQRVKGGLREFAAPGPRVWEVGARIGAALRRAAEQPHSHGETASGRASPRPHLRRAHWAIRWTGPRTSEQTPKLLWMAPTLVAAGDPDELPAVIHPVEE